METLKCDLLVVGAGPAGASAAREAARAGMKVLAAERREIIGVPVRCAEYVPAPLLGEVDLGRAFLVQSVRGMKTFLAHGEVQTIRAPGFSIRRDLFDQTLARAAVDAGARILLSTRVIGREGGKVILKKRRGEPAEVEAAVILGADGPRSTVGRWMGSVNRSPIPAVQVRVPLVAPLEFTEVYFDREIYGGYAWLFPRGGEANVGLGRKEGRSGSEPMGELLKRFLSRLASEGKIRWAPSGWTAGWIPAEPLGTLVRDNLLLAGDAAGQTHPITGAGVSQAVAGGRMAGRWAAAAVDRGGPDRLREYEEEWRDLFGESMEHAFKRRLLLEREWDRMEEILRSCWVSFREYYAHPE
jgi:digeranylgeranylglycerophospholipid reductase